MRRRPSGRILGWVNRGKEFQVSVIIGILFNEISLINSKMNVRNGSKVRSENIGERNERIDDRRDRFDRETASQGCTRKYHPCCNPIGRYFTISGRRFTGWPLFPVVLRDFNNNRACTTIGASSRRTTLPFDLR